MATRPARSTTVSVRPRECAVAAAAFEADQPPRPDFALQEGRVAFTFQALGAAQVYSVDVENGVGELLTGQVSIARYPELVLEPAPDFRDSFAVQGIQPCGPWRGCSRRGFAIRRGAEFARRWDRGWRSRGPGHPAPICGISWRPGFAPTSPAGDNRAGRRCGPVTCRRWCPVRPARSWRR